MRQGGKPDTWMPLVIGDYLKDTARLSTEQHGAYLLLIMDYWVNGPPPDDDAELSAITGLSPKAWRSHRDKLAKFFRIEDGHWRHKRVEEELERWAAKKEKYVARAQAGGRAKAAKSSASSTPQAVLTACLDPCLQAAPQPASTEEEASERASSLSGRQDAAALADGAASPVAWNGPEGVREAFVTALGDDWCRRFLDVCRWQDVPDRALLAPAAGIGRRIIKDASSVLRNEGLTILERAA
jgi:uncharacterized protein YdaU (DUF1376 family)